MLTHQDETELTACAQCDALYRMPEIPSGATAQCRRCGSNLFTPSETAAAKVVAFASAALILMVIAITLPFLEIEASGLSSKASVVDAILAFASSSGLMAPLSIIVAALIVLLPVARLAGVVYVVAPILLNCRVLPQAKPVFMIAMRLRPWAMAEIFIIGVAVALIKIGSLATVTFGPAFWAFAGLVVLVTAKDMVLCERSLWRILDTHTDR